MEIDQTRSKQLKRLFDVVSSLLLLFSLPLNIWFVKNKAGFIFNLFKVFSGRKTWVSYAKFDKKTYNLPVIKMGVINPIIASGLSENDSINTDRINLFYAKNYSVEKDLLYVFKGFKFLGN